MKSRLLILTKPLMNEYLELFGKLYEILQHDGELTQERKWSESPMERIHDLYVTDHGLENYFDGMVKLFEKQPCESYIYVNDQDDPKKWVNHVKIDLIGGPIIEKASPGSFRRIVHEFTGRVVEPLYKEKKPFDNGVHCSDSIENGERECNIFRGA